MGTTEAVARTTAFAAVGATSSARVPQLPWIDSDEVTSDGSSVWQRAHEQSWCSTEHRHTWRPAPCASCAHETSAPPVATHASNTTTSARTSAARNDPRGGPLRAADPRGPLRELLWVGAVMVAG